MGELWKMAWALGDRETHTGESNAAVWTSVVEGE